MLKFEEVKTKSLNSAGTAAAGIATGAGGALLVGAGIVALT
ncbi:hypothetical protein [Staphylococcus warneri]|nr:hypothetical protein [Staphylococcus warneri]